MKCDLLSDKEAMGTNNHFFLKPKDLALPKAEFDFDHKKVDDNYLITIRAHSFIYQLHLHSVNVKGIFSNNYFEMLPNEEVTIEFKPSKYFEANGNQISFEVNTVHELVN